MEKLIGVSCKSGRKAAIGVSIHMSYVGSPHRPQTKEFAELIQNARKELKKDEFWDGLLRDLRRFDEAERTEREKWLAEKDSTSGTSGVEGQLFRESE